MPDDEVVVIDPKVTKLLETIPKLIHDCNCLITFRVFRLKKGWEARHYSELKFIRNWLVTVIGLAKQVKEIENRHSPEVWERYARFGIKGLTEQTELNTRKQNMEMFLNKNKPLFITKGKPSRTAKVTYGPLKTESPA